jgi:hypothetical protein
MTLWRADAVVKKLSSLIGTPKPATRCAAAAPLLA